MMYHCLNVENKRPFWNGVSDFAQQPTQPKFVSLSKRIHLHHYLYNAFKKNCYCAKINICSNNKLQWDYEVSVNRNDCYLNLYFEQIYSTLNSNNDFNFLQW